MEKIEMCPMSDAQLKLYDRLFKRLKKTQNGDSTYYSVFMPTIFMPVMHAENVCIGCQEDSGFPHREDLYKKCDC